MNIKTTFLFIAILLFILFSCSEDEEIVLPLTDCWIEVEEESVIQFGGTNFKFCFLSDTEFTLELLSWTDQIVIGGCGNQTEYIKGTYIWTSESFEVVGNYVDSDFVVSASSCLGETEYTRTFTVKVISATEMILDNNDDNPTRGIRLLSE